jgi:G3E family GTPase
MMLSGRRYAAVYNGAATAAHMPEVRTPAVLITGATGAGKTTLVSHLLSQRPAHEQWAVLVNDFGKATFADERSRANHAVTIREVAGCICCTAHVALRVALVGLLRESRPERLIIEASGAAQPSALRNVLAAPGLAGAIELRAPLCVVEPRQLADPRYAANDVYRQQIAAADAIVISGDDAHRDAARPIIDSMRSTPARYLDPKGQDGFWPSPE